MTSLGGALEYANAKKTIQVLTEEIVQQRELNSYGLEKFIYTISISFFYPPSGSRFWPTYNPCPAHISRIWERFEADPIMRSIGRRSTLSPHLKVLSGVEVWIICCECDHRAHLNDSSMVIFHHTFDHLNVCITCYISFWSFYCCDIFYIFWFHLKVIQVEEEQTRLWFVFFGVWYTRIWSGVRRGRKQRPSSAQRLSEIVCLF